MTKALLATAVAAFVLAACGQDANKGAPKTGASPSPAPGATTPPPDKKDPMKK